MSPHTENTDIQTTQQQEARSKLREGFLRAIIELQGKNIVINASDFKKKCLLF